MVPKRPSLHPLTTPKTMTFPSELRERTYTTNLDPNEGCKKEDEDVEFSMTPPPAYTEFLNTFSPIFGSPDTSRANFSKYMLDKPRSSPTSTPSSSTATTFPGSHLPRNLPPAAAHPHVSVSNRTPDHVRRMRLPPPYAYTPASDSPHSAHPLRSPYTPSEMRMHRFDSPVSDHAGYFSVRHVVTTTITYKRAPQLEPPPQGKRRRNSDD
ncbi:uncharacterized protein KD926_010037 [Aspergillus affinis]|uniref:uncharacterized protein n=1 Tax=Aspergillus affinis TaxID=1070780 RepID=UPI0022FE5733|nr:uncharacterized protein KD926_010037 [Aspergillus affinis]KAI9039052.1 hypothetical protein KD926_010037 [Aspergillus affinis]